MAKQMPPILVIKRHEFEEAFKKFMSIIISNNKVTPGDMNDINRILSKWLITGMQNVDFENRRNSYELESLVSDLWNHFYRDLNLEVRKHRLGFIRKSLI